VDVLSAVQGRRSIRHYSSKPVEDAKLNKVLEAARLSPSATNLQDWKFIVIKSEKTKAMLAEAALGQTFVSQAHAVIVACATNPEGIMTCGQYRYTIDLSIAMAYMILEAHEQGLGTCWLGRFDEKKVKEILGIPEKFRVVTMTPLGYPDEMPEQRPRKKLEEIVCYEKYE
jgi:nitroreductase